MSAAVKADLRIVRSADSRSGRASGGSSSGWVERTGRGVEVAVKLDFDISVRSLPLQGGGRLGAAGPAALFRVHLASMLGVLMLRMSSDGQIRPSIEIIDPFGKVRA